MVRVKLTISGVVDFFQRQFNQTIPELPDYFISTVYFYIDIALVMT